ncbi:MAG: 1,2-phenylacetyl-CoA epoxidase subunit PaaE [Sphingomonadales bacterium]
MSLHFHPLTVKEVRQETADCVSLLFDVPETLQATYQFLPGQNLTLKATIHGEEVRRSYSICSAPQDKELRVAIKKVEGGVFSNYANDQLKAGDTLEVMPPAGKFNTPLQVSHSKRYLMIAAGSGITPILSLIKSILFTEPASTITLVYGNRSRSSIIFFEELEQLKNTYMQRLNMLHILSREKTDSPLQLGRIDSEKLTLLDRLIGCKNMDECFICGPEEMTLNSKAFLERAGMPAKKIHLELFTSSKIAARAKKNPAATSQEKRSSQVTIKLDGREVNIDIPLQEEITILDAALAQGADLPFACKGGMCCTCKAKLVSGEVMMDVHWGLEEEEVEQGYILTCQSYPKTEKLIVDFDHK